MQISYTIFLPASSNHEWNHLTNQYHHQRRGLQNDHELYLPQENVQIFQPGRSHSSRIYKFNIRKGYNYNQYQNLQKNWEDEYNWRRDQDLQKFPPEEYQSWAIQPH